MRMSRNSGKILWGLLFLLGAVYLIASKIWSLPGISVFNVILGVFCVWVLIEGIRHVNFWEILFPIAFICILFSPQLGLSAFTPWPVLGAALLGSIGLSMIFKPKSITNGRMQVHTATVSVPTVSSATERIFALTTVLVSRSSTSTLTIYAAYPSITVSAQPVCISTMQSFREKAQPFILTTVSERSVFMFRVHGRWMSMWIKRSVASICVDEWKAQAHIV